MAVGGARGVAVTRIALMVVIMLLVNVGRAADPLQHAVECERIESCFACAFDECVWCSESGVCVSEGDDEACAGDGDDVIWNGWMCEEGDCFFRLLSLSPYVCTSTWALFVSLRPS